MQSILTFLMICINQPLDIIAQSRFYEFHTKIISQNHSINKNRKLHKKS